MKVAVVGGGSTYTPELVSGLSRERERIPVDELVLHDIDPERRRVVGEMAARMLERQGFGGSLDVTDDLDAAVEGASFVLLQLRVGGQSARLSDETVPLACGCIGQETTGAGGFAKAMRTVPVVLEIAERVRELARPDAWIVDFTNPVGIVTRALLDEGHRAVGLCNVAIGLQREIAGLLGVAPERVVVDQVGLNHLTWVRRVLVDGTTSSPSFSRRTGRLWRSTSASRRGCSTSSARSRRTTCATSMRTTPSSRSSAQASRGRPRSRDREELLEIYRDPEVSEKPALLEQRGGAFYSEAATALIASLAAGTGDVQVVDVRTTARSRGWPTTTSSSSPRGSARTAPRRSPSRRSHPSCSGSCSTSPPTSGSRSRRRAPATRSPPARHCSHTR